MQSLAESELQQMEHGSSCKDNGDPGGERAVIGVTCDHEELREAEMDTVRLLPANHESG
jgi:hypothetical protein